MIYAVFGALGLLAMLYLITAPIRYCWKVLLNAFFGLCGLLFFNLLSGLTGLWLPLNLFDALLVGALGLPGLLLLLLLTL